MSAPASSQGDSWTTEDDSFSYTEDCECTCQGLGRACTRTPVDEPPKLPSFLGRGVKGSPHYTDEGVGDPRVVLNTKLVRGAYDVLIKSAFQDVLDRGSDEFITDAVLLAFHARDVRGGKGERALFQAMIQQLVTGYPGLVEELLELVPEYGGWFDLVHLAHGLPQLRPAIFKLFEAQLKKDEAAIATASAEGRSAASISLLAKWMPREGKKYAVLAQGFVKTLGTNSTPPLKFSQQMAAYRKRLAVLNAHLATVETLECAGRWDEIKPGHVPARARQLKTAAYLNEILRGRRKGLEGDKLLRKPADPKRMACRTHFQEFFAAAAAGTVKISGANTLYPHELVRKAQEEILNGPGGEGHLDLTNQLNAVWNEMVAAASKGGGLGNSVFMCDFSGSMDSSRHYHGSVQPILVSMAMGLLGASVNTGAFSGQFLSFDSDPRWIVIPEGAKTFIQQLRFVEKSRALSQGISTNFQAAAERLVESLKQFRVPAGQAPKNLIIVTDMGFDEASEHPSDVSLSRSANAGELYARQKATHVQLFQEAFRKASEEFLGDPAGWEPPRIVIWNVSADYSDNHQGSANEAGVLTLSGWSPSLFKILCEEGPRATTPLEGVKAMLEDTRYDPVRERVTRWLAGGWRQGC